MGAKIHFVGGLSNASGQVQSVKNSNTGTAVTPRSLAPSGRMLLVNPAIFPHINRMHVSTILGVSSCNGRPLMIQIRYSDEQIIGILKDVEAGLKVADAEVSTT
jgi:hypothetical protein